MALFLLVEWVYLHDAGEAMIELRHKEELEQAWGLMRQLRGNVSVQDFLSKVLQARERAGYRLFGFYDNGIVAGLCGVMPFFTLYHSDCLFVCDFVIDESLRGRGLGQQYFRAIESWAQSNGYKEIELSSSFAREGAHRFYTDKMGFDKSGFVFRKNLAC